MLARWWRKVRRRKPGIYWYITRKHLRPWSKESGYVGKSVHLEMRDNCHEGTCRHKGCVEKDWWDLVARRLTLRLPWWLGWDWVLLPLETVAIALLMPRYNWQKNPRPGKVGPRDQALQRQARDLAPASYHRRVQMSKLLDYAYRTVGVLVVLAGVGGWLWTR